MKNPLSSTPGRNQKDSENKNQSTPTVGSSNEMADDNAWEKHDKWLIIIIRLVHFLSLFFQEKKHNKDNQSAYEHLAQVTKNLQQLDMMPGHNGQIVIESKPHTSERINPEVADYFVAFAGIKLDLAHTQAVMQQYGVRLSHLSGRLKNAFAALSRLGLNNLKITLPVNSLDYNDHLYISFDIISKVFGGISHDRPIIIKQRGKTITVPLVKGIKGVFDPNLTTFAALNGLNEPSIQDLIASVQDFLKNSSADFINRMGNNMLFAIKEMEEFKDRFIYPPIEINTDYPESFMGSKKAPTGDQHVDKIEKKVPKVSPLVTTRADLKKYIIYKKGWSDELKRLSFELCKEDLHGMNVSRFSKRLRLLIRITELLKIEEPHYNAILKNFTSLFQADLEKTDGTFFNALTVLNDAVKIDIGGKTTLFGNIDGVVLNLIAIVKETFDIQNKLNSIVELSRDFTDEKMEKIAKIFSIDIQDVKNINQLLKSCFDQNNRFVKRRFETIVPDLVNHEKIILEFLWGYFKNIDRRQDRVAFLNSLQFAIGKISQPKRALKLLITDICIRPSSVSFSDRNAFMLANQLLRKYNKELDIDIELTPEEVLLVKNGLDHNIVKYAAWKVDLDKLRFEKKIQTIRNKINSFFNSEGSDMQPMPIYHLLSLEREALIFLALVSGETARSVFQTAIIEYGNIKSGIYRFQLAEKHINTLLQHLIIAVRGLGRVGKKEDALLLEEVKASRYDFLLICKSSFGKRILAQTMKWVDAAIENISGV